MLCSNLQADISEYKISSNQIYTVKNAKIADLEVNIKAALETIDLMKMKSEFVVHPIYRFDCTLPCLIDLSTTPGSSLVPFITIWRFCRKNSLNPNKESRNWKAI